MDIYLESLSLEGLNVLSFVAWGYILFYACFNVEQCSKISLILIAIAGMIINGVLGLNIILSKITHMPLPIEGLWA